MWNPFKAVASVVTNPIRGLGRIVRGNFKEGFGDILGSAATIAPFTGIGLLPSLAIKAADDLVDDGKLDFGGLAGSAASHYLGGKVLDKLKGAGDAANVGGNILSGEKIGLAAKSGGGGLSSAAPKFADIVAERVANPVQSTLLNAAAAPAAAGIMRNSLDPGVNKSLMAKLGLGDLTGGDKVDLASNLLGTGMNAYGAYQEGKAMDERMKWEKERDLWERGHVDTRARRSQNMDPVRAQLLKYFLTQGGI